MKNVGYTSLARHMALTITAKYSRLSPKSIHHYCYFPLDKTRG